MCRATHSLNEDEPAERSSQAISETTMTAIESTLYNHIHWQQRIGIQQAQTQLGDSSTSNEPSISLNWGYNTRSIRVDKNDLYKRHHNTKIACLSHIGILLFMRYGL
jgi:hypothetical protein